jgi:hypothetical protein
MKADRLSSSLFTGLPGTMSVQGRKSNHISEHCVAKVFVWSTCCMMAVALRVSAPLLAAPGDVDLSFDLRSRFGLRPECPHGAGAAGRKDPGGCAYWSCQSRSTSPQRDIGPKLQT